MNNNTTTNTETYNGWSNWDTWNSYNWITDDELMHRRACCSTDPDHLHETIVNYILRMNDEERLMCDKRIIDIDNVNWVEIYDAFNEGV